ncbi:MAG TPA: SpoIIE family protein phosphatase [Actinomycetota bacterium]|nr:SpoIIE family protein phosphatase [Actinomycetota bacterium]
MKLSLRWKIVGGFGLLLLLIVLLGFVTVSLFSSLRSVQRKVFNEAIPELVAVDELVRSYTAQSAAVHRLLIGSGSAPLLDQYRQEVGIAEVWEQRAERLFQEAEDQRLLEELTRAGRRFQELVDQEVIPLAETGKRSQAFRVLGSEGSSLISEIETLGSLLRQSQDRVVAQSENQLRARSNQALLILIVVILAALAAGTMLAIKLPRRLVADLSALVDATRAIERGDLAQKIEIQSGDEIEELGRRFEDMQAGLKRLQQLALQDRELEIAASVQRNLLQRSMPSPTEATVVPLQRQANLVGGDWYDVHAAGKTLTVAVGDASGKGIGAALMAAIALSVLRAERRLGASPKLIIERTNEALREASDQDSFTTLIYATLDFGSGEARWLNMGHPSPFLMKGPADDGARTGYFLEGPRNRVLGWFDDPGLAETIVRLDPGDRLVFFTDGFIEAKSVEGEVFGQHRLAERMQSLSGLPSGPLGEALVEEVERYAAGKLDDDLTMLIVEFQGANPEAPSEEGVGAWHSRK